MGRSATAPPSRARCNQGHQAAFIGGQTMLCLCSRSLAPHDSVDSLGRHELSHASLRGDPLCEREHDTAVRGAE